MNCEKCGYEYNYDDPTASRTYYTVEEKNEMTHGRSGVVAYCKKCAPFGNTKIPTKFND